MGSVLPYGPQIAEHCILRAGLQPTQKLAAQPLQPEDIQKLMASIQELEAWLQGCADSAAKGYIYSKGSGELRQRLACGRHFQRHLMCRYCSTALTLNQQDDRLAIPCRPVKLPLSYIHAKLLKLRLMKASLVPARPQGRVWAVLDTLSVGLQHVSTLAAVRAYGPSAEECMKGRSERLRCTTPTRWP